MAHRSVRQGSPGADRRKISLSREFRRAMTPAEHALWAALRRGALGHIVRRQHVIRGWIVDFYIPGVGLVIEVDGDVHDMQIEDDRQRTEVLEREGLRVIRVRNEKVLDALPEVVAQVAEAVHTVR
jgi:very-short-patch-repair endonuclease